jgi:hypothetical protein
MEAAFRDCDGNFKDPAKMASFVEGCSELGEVSQVDDLQGLFMALATAKGSIVAEHEVDQHLTLRRRVTMQEAAQLAATLMSTPDKDFSAEFQTLGTATGPILNEVKTPYEVVSKAIESRR